MFELLALELIVLRTVEGRNVHVNPAHVVSLTERFDERQNKVLSDKVQCAVGLLDSKFISVAESCESVRRKLQAHGQEVR